MNKTITLIAFFALISTVTYAVECEVAYQDATYGYQHAETAMEANNVEQLKQYANRSKIAIRKVLLSTEKCGCQDANNASYDALTNLDKALEKEKFEAIRMFVNRARKNAKDIIIALDICSATDPAFALKETEGNILAQEKLLLEQQQKLLEQQEKLRVQLEEQRKLQAEIAIQKEEMLELQRKVRLASELDLTQLETLINDFTQTMGCKDTQPLTESSYLKTEHELGLETLEATKAFYVEKAKEMANNLLNRLSSCEWKTEK
ncbi:MAG: hypothetical protein JKY22_01030 [Flavobacteriaceae bacterium]|nr:hypothetical protein [Flavobacteriaceae bacterium]